MLRISFGIGILLLFTAAPAVAEIARVKTSSGTAFVQRGQQKLKPVPGLPLNAQDTLVTGKDGRIAVTFVDNTRFAVGPDSDVVVSEFQYDRARQKGSMVTQVNRGSLAVVSGKIAKSGKDAMKVRTPNTLLGVRGTKFIVDVGK